MDQTAKSLIRMAEFMPTSLVLDYLQGAVEKHRDAPTEETKVTLAGAATLLLIHFETGNKTGNEVIELYERAFQARKFFDPTPQ